uniref:Protein-export membrane protein SecG n=1 Tax=Candidatus Kentrum sp. LFY TaxID=2126342 RepID=A0A450UEA8_9GAMM|nr:MAG: preprotein translocase subunit SecG [Candidatus Kentron sp. LFY]
MQQFFMIVHVLAALAVIGLVLLQHGRGADAGAAFGSGASGTLFGSRGPATFLARITTILAATFFLTSIALAYIASHSVERESVVVKSQDDKRPDPPTVGEMEEVLSVPPEPLAVNVPEQENPGVDTPLQPVTDGKDSLSIPQRPGPPDQ